MDYRKKLKVRTWVALTYIILGIAAMAAAIIAKTDNDFVSALGFALIIMGVARLRNHRRITKSEETIKHQEIAETDERNLLIIRNARSTAFIIYLLLTAVAVIVLSLLKFKEAASFISLSMFSLVVIYWICYFVYRKKL